MFWLSHHHPPEYHRTYLLGPVRVCARCLGTYPVMAAAIVLQFLLRSPLAHPLDPILAVGLLAPALVDWARSQFRPRAGSNAFRTFTGVLLGISLSRTLFVHFQRPFHLWLLAQGALVTAVALPVILATYQRRKGG